MDRPIGVECLAITSLKPSLRNSRTHSKAQIKQIAASIEAFGFTNPVLVDETKTILAGHGRVEAAKQLGLKDVPVVRIEHMSAGNCQGKVSFNRPALRLAYEQEPISLFQNIA